MHVSNIRNGIIGGMKYIAFFVIVFMTSFSFAKNIFAETLHSVPEGGYWKNASTWVENKIPTANDSVVINGMVSFSYSYDIQDIHINENGQLTGTSYTGISMNAASLSIENNARFTGNNFQLFVSGDIHNYGAMTSFLTTASGSVYNYGNMGSLSIEGENSKEFIGFETIPNVYIYDNFTLSNNPHFNKINLGNYEISFDHSDGYIEASEISAQAGAAIHGELRTGKVGTRLRFSELSVQTLVVNHISAFDQDMILHGDLVISEGKSLHQNGYYSYEFTINGNLELKSESEFSSNLNRVGLFVNGNILNRGIIDENVSVDSFGDVDNQGSIGHLFLKGSAERNLLGLENVGEVYIFDDIVSQNDVSFGKVTFSDDCSFNFSNDTKIMVFTGTVVGHVRTNGNIVLDGHIYIRSPEIHASSFLVSGNNSMVYNNDLHFYTDVIFKDSASLSLSASSYGAGLYFYKDLFVGENVAYLNTQYSSPPSFILGNIDFHGQTRGSFVLSHNKETDSEIYNFKYAYAVENILENLQTNSENIINTINVNEENIIITDLVKSEQQLFWQSKSNVSDWSEVHTINKPLYLEKDPNFFTTSVIPEITINTEIEIAIHAQDPAYNGTISISSDVGYISPNQIEMEAGTAIGLFTFDAITETNNISIQSENLSGASNEFSVIPAGNPNFFTLVLPDEIYQNTEIEIEITALDSDYTGTLHLDDSTGYIIPRVEVKNGKAYTKLSFPEISQGNILHATDVDRVYFSGESNSFSVIEKKTKSKKGSIISTIKNSLTTLFTSKENTENSELEMEPITPEIQPEEVSQENTPNIDEPKEEIKETPYLLENECLGIYSERTSLHKGNLERENNKKIQSFLKKYKFLSGPIDGIFGNKTKTALQEFQKQNGLFVDGIFGKGTSSFIDRNCGNISNMEIASDLEIKEVEVVEKEIDEITVNNTPVERETWFDGIIGWFKNSWLGNLFGFENLSQSEQNQIKIELQQIITEVIDENGNKVIQVNDYVALEKLVNDYGLKIPGEDRIVKDINGDEIPVPFPEEVVAGKILDVPYIPQRIKINGVNSPQVGGGSMCSGASVTMIAEFYKKLTHRSENIMNVDNAEIDQDLREYVWDDKSQGLGKSCYVDAFQVDGSFAVTSNQQCDLGRNYSNYFNHYGLQTGQVKQANKSSYTFSDIKGSIENNRPVLMGEPGHIMVATGYLEIPESDKTQLLVNVEYNGVIIADDVLVKKDFVLIVNDPKRNRNRVGDTGYFSSDGNQSSYLIVSRKNNKNEKIEYMCRSGRGYKGLDREYVCTKAATTALSVFE